MSVLDQEAGRQSSLCALFVPLDTESTTVFRNAWQQSAIDQGYPDRDLMEQRIYVRQVADNAKLEEPDSEYRDAIETYASIADYMWFSDGAAPLPKGMVGAYVNHGSEPHTLLNPMDVNELTFENTGRFLAQQGLGQLAVHREEVFARQAESILRPVVAGVVGNLPAYRLLESFSVTRHEWRDRPLTVAEREIEMQIAEQRVRRRYAIPPHASLFENPAAEAELRRVTYYIDETTRYDRTDIRDVGTPTKRARKYFYDHAASLARGRIEHIETVDSSSIRIATDRECYDWGAESFYSESFGTTYLHDVMGHYADGANERMISNAVRKLFEKNNDESYNALLREVLESEVDLITDDFKRFAVSLPLVKFRLLATMLFRPTVATHSFESIFRGGIQPLALYDRDRMGSGQELRASHRRTTGRIHRRPSGDTAARLIQYQPLNPDLPSTHEDADLIVQACKAHDDLMMHIPGYEIVGYDQNDHTFGFRFNVEADPYAPCMTPIPQDEQMTLAHMYADMGLHQLAALVGANEHITVQDLAAYIAQTNRYAMPKERKIFTITDALEDFSDFVHDGYLSMQCVQSSYFLQKSLQKVFGQNSASTLGGDCLPTYGSRISGIKHRQTSFIDPDTNQYYILDATPKAQGLAFIRERVEDFANQTWRSISSIAGNTAVRATYAPVQSAPLPHLTTEPTTAELAVSHPQLEHVRHRDILITQLQLIYGNNGQPLPKTELFQQIARLPSNDVVRRTLSILVRTANGLFDEEEGQQLLTYIQRLQTCTDASLLQKVDPRNYTAQPRLLDTLAQTLSATLRAGRRT